MREYFLNHMWVFDCGNDFHIAATQVASFEVDIEDAL